MSLVTREQQLSINNTTVRLLSNYDADFKTFQLLSDQNVDFKTFLFLSNHDADFKTFGFFSDQDVDGHQEDLPPRRRT